MVPRPMGVDWCQGLGVWIGGGASSGIWVWISVKAWIIGRLWIGERMWIRVEV